MTDRQNVEPSRTSVDEFEAMIEGMRNVACACGFVGAGPQCNVCASAEREAQRLAAIANRVKRVEEIVPKAFAWAHFDAPELTKRIRTTSSIAAARQAVGARWVVLTGGAGDGKTSLAVAMLRAWAKSDASGQAFFVTAIRLAMARVQHRIGDGDAALVDRALSARFLVLDGLGEERETKTSAVYDVIYERHAHELPTVITTTFFEEGVEARYGEGVARRVFESTRAQVIDLAPPARAA
jgi:DNA replication protein DnaC